MDLKVIDNSNYAKPNLFKVIFFRNNDNIKCLSRLKWMKLTLLEMTFGSELLENVFFCSTRTSTRNISGDKEEYGKEITLNSYIPNGVFINFFRESLIEVLFYKYYQQYFLIMPCSNTKFDTTSTSIDCTRNQFFSKKSVFNQLISIRRIYELTHIMLNLLIDLLVYIVTDRIDLALLSALFVESIRRILKV